jgi:hypothetical protein
MAAGLAGTVRLDPVHKARTFSLRALSTEVDVAEMFMTHHPEQSCNAGCAPLEE